MLFIHILSGAIALLVAPVAMVVKKGGSAHRIWGKVFFWGMTAVFVTAVILSTFRWNPFLLLLAVFSYYSVVSGYRWIYLKKLNEGQEPAMIDWMSLVITTVFNIAFVIYGIYFGIRGGGTFAYLAVGFGVAGLSSCFGNIKRFTKPHDRNTWLYQHIGGMLGGYIATLTAFSAQVLQFMPTWLQWTWPSIIGVPIIYYWLNRLRRTNKVVNA